MMQQTERIKGFTNIINPLLWLLLLAVLGSLPASAQQSLDSADDADYGKVARLHISGVINRVRHLYLQRALERADAQNIDTLIVQIDTDGGEVFHAREILKQILEQPREGRRTIAFVDFRAISAGAMIAYGHQQIYISDTATIGDIGVIFVKPGGEIEYAPEKIETVVRALLAQAAEQNGWNRGALLKMTARNQNLYRITLADDETAYIIEDDLPEFLALHPEIDEKDSSQFIVYRGKDRLLTLTGREAIKLGMATALAPDLPSLYQKLGIAAADVVDLSPNLAENLAALLAGWAPLLAGLALLFIIFELKTPGVGLWALLGAACGVLFIVSQYTLEMIDYMELILIVFGLALIAVEFFTLAGGGLLAVAGAMSIFIGLMLAFIPNEFSFDLSDERFLSALRSAALRGLISVGILIAGILSFIAFIPRSRLGSRLALQSEIKADSSGAVEKAAARLLGRQGISRDALSPGGMVIIDGTAHSARAAHGAYIAAGQNIEVIAVEFGELIVRANSTDESAEAS